MEKKAEERISKMRGLNESEQQRMERVREEERKQRILEHIETLKNAAAVRKRELERTEEEVKHIREKSKLVLKAIKKDYR